MNKLNYEILSAIDNIETTVMESEMNVMNSLIDSYSKSIMILECCDDNVDTSSFDIFQEGFFTEADDNKNYSKAKRIINKIVDFFKMLGRMIKNGCDFIKRKIKNMVKPVSEEVVNKAKSSVGDDEVTVEITEPTNSSGKPEVTVSTASHDTEKEEQIKSKIKSVISSTPSHTKSNSQISFGNGNSGTAALSSEPVKNIMSTVISKQYEEKDTKSNVDSKTSVKISKDDIEVTYIDCSNRVNVISSTCKKIGELFTTIDISRMGEPKYLQEFVEKFTDILVDFFDGIFAKLVKSDKETKTTYSDFIKYTNNMKASLEGSMNILENCSDTLEKSIMSYKNKNNLNNISEKDIKDEAKYIIDGIEKNINVIHKGLIPIIQTSINHVNDEVKSVNESIKSVL